MSDTPTKPRMTTYQLVLRIERRTWEHNEQGDPVVVDVLTEDERGLCESPHLASVEQGFREIHELWIDAGHLEGCYHEDACDTCPERPCRHDWPKEEPKP